jgi:hypothetical protein
VTDATDAGWEVDTAPVETLMQVLLKALRAAQLYLPNNPVYQTALENVRKAFPSVWELTEELTLAVLETELKWEGKVVLSQPRNESLAWLLFKDGLRSVRLDRGVEHEELVRLLQVINKARNLPGDAQDDLLTLLWEQDFQFIRYDFVELATDDQRQIQAEAREEVVVTREAIQEEAAEEEAEEPDQRLSGIVRLEDFDSTLYFLDEKDIAYLRAEIDREYEQDLRTNTLTILFDLFELQPFPAVRAEILSILDNFIPYLLGVGDYRAVAYLLRDLRVVVDRSRELLPEHRATLNELPARLSRPDVVGQLLQSLDEGPTLPAEQDLSALFRELRPEALETILDWMPRLHAEPVRNLLSAAVQRIAAVHPDAVTRALGSENPAVVHATIELAGRLRLPPTVPALGHLLIDGAPEFKVGVVEALAAIGTPSAMQQLETAVTDSARDVRVAAVRVLGSRRHQGALAQVEAMTFGRDLRGADLSEKTAFFEAFGLLAGAAGVARLVPLLEPGGGLFKKKADPETRACAAMALGKIGTPEARQVLEAAIQDKDPLVRNAVGRALQPGGSRG